MSTDRSQRIDDALFSLIEKISPRLRTETAETAEDRHDETFQQAKEILDDPASAGSSESEINYAHDLIKKRLIQDRSEPELALRFSNLYSRLLNQPVLSQKWGILYLLNNLADGGEGGGVGGGASVGGVGDGSSASSPAGSHTRFPKARPKVDGEATAREGKRVRVPGRKQHQDQQQGQQPPPPPPHVDENDMGQERPNGYDGYDGYEPSEAALLRDLPFTLQGLSSANLPFSSTGALSLPKTLPPPMIYLLHTLAEPSLLYRSLSEFVSSSESGLVGQSVRYAVGGELRSYLKLVASLEADIRRALSLAEKSDQQKSVGQAGMTLRRCVIYTREATMGLRLMNLIVEESKNKKGGQLISVIHGFSSSHGDPLVGAFAERLLTHVTQPFYDMLRKWIYDGELCDPHQEFFVIEQYPGMNLDTTSSADSRKAGATSVWEDKYKLDETMIPSIMTYEFAKKVFLIGKSLNFIRYGCGDSGRVEEYSKKASRELRYGDTATLETSIDEAYETTMARLTHLMDHKFKLFDHLAALKKYLLLGQGDFVALLMESLSSSLERPANTLFRHSLTAQLEHSIRGSNAQYDPADVLRRLDARMLMQGHGDIGWDCFTLEYKIDAPVNVIVTPEGSRKYLKVFNFLWRIKRVEFALGTTWRRCMTGSRGVLAAVAEKVGREWKLARCCIAEMIHFVTQLQYYILFEVIESSWDELQVAVKKPGATLDDLIGAHAKYLEAITHKGLLGAGARGASGNKEDSFLMQLHEILKIMLAYKDAVEGLYSFSVTEFSRRQELHARIETRTAQGKWGITEADEEELRSPSPLDPSAKAKNASSSISGTEDHMLPTLGQRLRGLSNDFRARVNVLLGDLAHQPDVDMRFLGVSMNFNDFYQPVRRKRKEKSKEKEKTPAAQSGEKR